VENPPLWATGQLFFLEMTRLLVTGSRSIFADKNVVGYALVQALYDLGGRVDQVIHGGAIGVDTLAGEWATAQGFPVLVVRPRVPGKRGFIERDAAMVDMATHVVAIWDGESRGTRFTMEYARGKGKLHSLWREGHVLEELYG
jgi:hypothetical protein